MPTIALFGWPIISLILFATLGREKGLIWTVIVGYLLLPEGVKFDLPGLPPYDKRLAISLSACLGAAFFWKKLSWPEATPYVEGGYRLKLVFTGLMVLAIFGMVMTVRDNGFNIINDGKWFFVFRPALSMRDVIGMMSETLTFMVPFFLAWRLLKTPQHHRHVMLVLVITGCICAVLALFEMRMSPRLNVSIYGYFPHDWLQHIRGGRFRPVIFLRHGLWLALFLLTAALAAYALVREHKSFDQKVMFLGSAVFITAVLLLSPNLGAAVLLFLFLPVVFLSRAIQVRVISTVTIIFLAFPVVRQAELLPIDSILSFFAKISEERASSLEFRFDNEDDLLARAAEKPLFGWGGWNRSRVVNEFGVDTTVADGLWIIVLSQRGWVGYISFFAILTLPLLLLRHAARKNPPPHTTMVMGIILAANLVYLVPNSALSPIGWLLSGAIAGFVAWKEVPSEKTEETGAQDERDLSIASSHSPYTRFGRGNGQDQATTLRRTHSRRSRTE